MLDLFNSPASQMAVSVLPRPAKSLQNKVYPYILATLNLYGTFSVEDFLAIYQDLSGEVLADKDFQVLLKSFLAAEGGIAFKDGCLISLDRPVQKSKVQSLRPYLPDRVEFLRYQDPAYNDNPYVENMSLFLGRQAGVEPYVAEMLAAKIADDIRNDQSLDYTLAYLQLRQLDFSQGELQGDFLRIYQQLKDNQRLPSLKGHTERECLQARGAARAQGELASQWTIKLEDSAQLREGLTLSAADPCSCQSAKLLEECCGLNLEHPNSHLSQGEAEAFWDLLHGLATYLNQRLELFPPSAVMHPLIGGGGKIYHQLLEKLWDQPELLLDYGQESAVEEQTRLCLKDWYYYHLPADFIVCRYTEDGALLLGLDSSGVERLYEVKGISESMGQMLKLNPPFMIRTVLLPFKNQIIFQSTAQILLLEIKEEAQQALYQRLEDMLARELRSDLIER